MDMLAVLQAPFACRAGIAFCARVEGELGLAKGAVGAVGLFSQRHMRGDLLLDDNPIQSLDRPTGTPSDTVRPTERRSLMI
jgi:hypothetical protein